MPVPEDHADRTQMLEIATLNGAHVAGLEDRTGSLTPGKQADVVVARRHRAERGAGASTRSPRSTLCADVSNVDTVIVDGVVRKRDGKLLGRRRRGPAGWSRSPATHLAAAVGRRAEQHGACRRP